MTSPKKDSKEHIPDFLKRDAENKDKEILKKAYCKLARDRGLTPEQASHAKIHIRDLLPNM